MPPAHDRRNWMQLRRWLGHDGQPLETPGCVSVFTAGGWTTARPGDWIVLSVTGEFHVARAGATVFHA